MTLFFEKLDSIAHRQLQSARTGELYSQSASISELIGLKDVFVHHEIIAPGRRASAPHTHSEQEEMVFVLEGHPTAHLGDQAVQLVPGGFIGFAPGAVDAHYVENQSEGEVRILVISPKIKTDKVRAAMPEGS